MDISNIIYYTREDEKCKTLSLRDLCLRDEADLEIVFSAVKEATDTKDLLTRMRRLCCDVIEMETENLSYIRFTVLDVYGNTNYLKFKKRKDN
jgi:hypothetical protein